MTATFVITPEEDRSQFVNRLVTFYAGKTIRVHVEEIEQIPTEQQHLLDRMGTLRLLTESIPVTMPSGLDVNDIIDEI